MIRWLCIVGFLSALPSAARADGFDDPDTQAVRRHFDRGRELYLLDHFREALDEFLLAKRVKTAPGLEFDIAVCHERLEEWGAAADAYEHYLALARQPPNAAEVYSRIAQLRERARGSAPPIKSSPVPALAAMPPPPPARPTPVYKKWWLWTVVGVVAAGAAVGITVGVLASRAPAFNPNLPESGPGVHVGALVSF